MKIQLPIIMAGLTALSISCFAQGGPGPAPGGRGGIDISKLPPPSDKKGVTFDSDIKPIFQADCVSCHGGQRPSSGLRLDTLQNVLAGRQGRGGAQPVLTAGNSAGSPIVAAVSRLDPRTAMPPPPRGPRRGAGGPGMGGANAGGASTNAPAATPPAARGPQPKNLTPEEVGLVRAWIDQGAK